MLRSVLGKAVHDLWRPLLAWTVFAGLWPGFYIALYPSIGAVDEMRQLLDAMPAALRAIFVTEGLDIGSPEGYLNMELFSFVLPLLLMAWTIPVGAGATAGEEERGTLDLLLALPVARWRVFAEKAVAMAGGTIVVCAGVLVGLLIGAATVAITLDLGRIAAGIVMAGLLGLAFGGVALLVGALTGRRLLAIALPFALAVAAFFLNTLGALVDALDPWRALSPFFHYIGGDPLVHGIDPGSTLVLLGMTLATTVLAAIAFERRDLAA
jgi:ABC-2 type transport system permease protein